MQRIINFSDCEYSIRHGTYGGRAGDKDGILYQNQRYIIKYPKKAKYFQNLQDIGYVTSPLSEYIGSHIYEILGYETHKTIMGYRNNKIVVACKDFCEKPSMRLMEMRTIKNGANREMESMLDTQFQSSATGDTVNLNEQILHLKYNPTLKKIKGVTERFWETAIIDILIDNNDRNNGNWGILLDEDTGHYKIAPIYDNGNAFSNKASDRQLQEYITKGNLEERLTGSRTAYEYNGELMSAKKLVNLDIPELKRAIVKTVPNIEQHIKDINAFIQDIPETYKGEVVCSDIRKQYYMLGIETRLDKLLKPAYNRIIKDRPLPYVDLFDYDTEDNNTGSRK